MLFAILLIANSHWFSDWSSPFFPQKWLVPFRLLFFVMPSSFVLFTYWILDVPTFIVLISSLSLLFSSINFVLLGLATSLFETKNFKMFTPSSSRISITVFKIVCTVPCAGVVCIVQEFWVFDPFFKVRKLYCEDNWLKNATLRDSRPQLHWSWYFFPYPHHLFASCQ